MTGEDGETRSVGLFGFRRSGFAQRTGEIILHPIENPINEPTGIRATESLGQFDCFVDRNDRWYVVAIEHFVNREPKDIAIHCRDSMKLVIVAVLSDPIIDFGQMADHAVDQRLRKLAYARRGGAKLPELIHTFRSAISMQIAPEMKLNRCLAGHSPFPHKINWRANLS